MDIGDITESYWVCGRLAIDLGSGTDFSLKVVVNGDVRNIAFSGTSDQPSIGEDPIGPYNLRLCFKLKDELPIKGGNGEKETPYQLVETE